MNLAHLLIAAVVLVLAGTWTWFYLRGRRYEDRIERISYALLLHSPDHLTGRKTNFTQLQHRARQWGRSRHRTEDAIHLIHAGLPRTTTGYTSEELAVIAALCPDPSARYSVDELERAAVRAEMFTIAIARAGRA